jgi:hypothetical protein
MRRLHWSGPFTTGIALALLATPAAAQQQQFAVTQSPVPAVASTPAAALPTTPAPTAATLGPTYTAAQLGIHQEAAAPTALNRDAFLPKRREGRALAIVGGAALLAGLLIGGDGGTVIAVGGAGLGLYGLYVWLR